MIGVFFVSKTLVLIDFENLYMGPLETYSLALTSEGIKKLIEVFKSSNEIANGDILLAACWQNYRSFETQFANSGYKTISIFESGKNTADGYLIVKSLLKFELEKGRFEKIILVAGDGVYAGLVRHFVVDNEKKLTVYTWTNSKSNVYRVNDNMDVIELENVFEFTDGKPNNAAYFMSAEPNKIEEELIVFMLNTRQPFTFRDYYANRILQKFESGDPIYTDLNTFEKAKGFLDDCISQGIVSLEHVPDTREGRENKFNKALVLNRAHNKVIKTTLKKRI